VCGAISSLESKEFAPANRPVAWAGARGPRVLSTESLAAPLSSNEKGKAMDETPENALIRIPHSYKLISPWNKDDPDMPPGRYEGFFSTAYYCVGGDHFESSLARPDLDAEAFVLTSIRADVVPACRLSIKINGEMIYNSSSVLLARSLDFPFQIFPPFQFPLTDFVVDLNGAGTAPKLILSLNGFLLFRLNPATTEKRRAAGSPHRASSGPHPA
jgi:hypothetical protein